MYCGRPDVRCIGLVAEREFEGRDEDDELGEVRPSRAW